MTGFDGVEIGFLYALESFVVGDYRAGFGEAKKGLEIGEDVLEASFGGLGLKLNLVGEGKKSVGGVWDKGAGFVGETGPD